MQLITFTDHTPESYIQTHAEQTIPAPLGSLQVGNDWEEVEFSPAAFDGDQSAGIRWEITP